MADQLEGHMNADTTERRALCGVPDAYIIDQRFDIDFDANQFVHNWPVSISCERCIEKILRLKGIDLGEWETARDIELGVVSA